MLGGMSSIGSNGASGRVVAMLGPTNTGKTHYAVDRMLGHRTGVIGLPLRLLARELYDRVAASAGRSRAALVTGEEKIVPANADYFLCTVEAMPVDRRFAFLAVDEIQLAADGERGHVFTDRLLRARGLKETMFLGSETMRPVIRRLVPDARFVSRPRFSTLGFAGRKKLSRLPKRSAVVSFSAPGVYATAELIRRHRGGAAVVLGALSPRTRNAQVAMFEAGDVDYLVATDAIGMGLNLNVDHVAFARLSKYDGLARRDLTPVEIGQIAGRAGRHMRDGTFGTTADAGSLEPMTVERVENHRFDRVETVQWRSAALDVTSARGLIASLESAPPADLRGVLARTRDAEDHMALKSLAAEPGIAALAKGRAAVKTLWDVCRIPDFRKTMAEAHARLLGRIYRRLMSPAGVLPTDWLADHVARLDRTDGDIDTLAARIAHIRTWTYISHRGEWLSDSRHWRERTRTIEDKLSDTLHERLTQRFVDRRAAALLRRVNEKQPVHGYVDDDGAVVVEGHAVGRVEGFRFVPDRVALPAGNRSPRAAVSRVVARELQSRVERLISDGDAAIALTPDRTLDWRGTSLARLKQGKDALHPGVAPFPSGLDGDWTRRAQTRLERWLADYIDRELRPLARLTDLTEAEANEVGAAGRGLLFRLREAMGLLPRAAVENQIGRLGRAERAALRRRGVRFGANSVFLPAMLRPERSALAVRLWQLHRTPRAAARDTPAPRPSAPARKGAPPGFYGAAGYVRLGRRAIRADVAERLTDAIRRQARKSLVRESEDLMALAGCSGEEFARVMRDLGYRRKPNQPGVFAKARGRAAKAAAVRGRAAKRPANPDSPFAVLGELAAGAGRGRT